jgi:osmoprotectant transport system permease protein
MTFSEYVQTRSDELAKAFGQHALVVVVAMVIATVLGVGGGMLTWRRPRLSGFAIGVSSGFLTIPSFALLGLLIPVLGLGWTPTVFALTLYSLLPIIRNTVVGLRGVDAAIIEAGRGMGMSAFHVLWRLQLPLAWPLILTGVRVSTQMIIGITAIAAYVAGPGLGHQILDGLARLGSANSLNEALAGTLGVVILALLADLLFLLIRLLTGPRGLRVRQQ